MAIEQQFVQSQEIINQAQLIPPPQPQLLDFGEEDTLLGDPDEAPASISGLSGSTIYSETNLDLIPPPRRTDLKVMRGKVSAHGKCERFCRCKCHVQKQVGLPQWTKAVVGSLYGSFTGSAMPGPPECDYARCRQSGAYSTQLSYIFPSWLMGKSVSVSGTWSKLSGPAVTWTLRMPRVIPDQNRIWSLVEAGSVANVRKAFENNEASIHDVDEAGFTLLHVCEGILLKRQVIPISFAFAIDLPFAVFSLNSLFGMKLTIQLRTVCHGPKQIGCLQLSDRVWSRRLHAR